MLGNTNSLDLLLYYVGLEEFERIMRTRITHPKKSRSNKQLTANKKRLTVKPKKYVKK